MTVLDDAREQENKYEWLEAAKSYEQALHVESPNVSFGAEMWERIGFCYGLASRQTENLEEFKKLMQLAVEAYKGAAKLSERKGNMKNQGKSAQCKAVAEHLGSWLASHPLEKRKMLDECLKLGKKSLEAYKNAGDELSYGKMCNDLLLCLLDRLNVASNSDENRNVAQKGIDLANEAVAVLSKLGNKNELLRAYFTASRLSWYTANISEQKEKRKEHIQRSLSYSENALKLSVEVDNPYYTAMSNWAAAFCILFFTEKVGSSLEHAKEMLRQGTIVKDNYLKGVASYILAFVTNWITLMEVDPDKKKKGQETTIKYAEDAIHYLQSVSQDFFIAQAYRFYVESYSSLAHDGEASSEEKRAILDRAVETGRKGLEHATRSGSPDATIVTLHALGKVLHFYSNLETGKEEKKRLLEEALVHRKEYNKVAENAFPSSEWVRGVGKNYEGLVKAELARLDTDKDKKRVLLESAISDMKDGVSRCRKWILSRPVPTLIAAIAGFEDGLGGRLNELYLLTGDERTLSRAFEVYRDAAKDFKKVGLPSRAAESYWKMARGQDRLSKHGKAAEDFENAFAEYKNAAQRITNFADFYQEYATYMKAWSEIEKAKLAHDREEYASAMKHYKKTATLLKPSKLWGYLSSNFLAWSLLENAEALSRRGSSTDSIEAFRKAAELFKQAKEAFEEEIDRIQNLDEREKADELSSASVRRKDYCLARVTVEEARMYDRIGEYAESAEKYDLAATTFEEIMEMMETEADRKEMKPIVYMCRAWQKMKMADGRVSPELYFEASQQFLKAKEHSTKDKTALLASGNHAFCKALEHGVRFEATIEKDEFFRAKEFLESAAKYYLKAGFENASLWTSATEVLFDGYNYMGSAEVEVDPEKKMRRYLLAEKCLERSAGLYESAGFVGKRDEVLRYLNKVKEKKEFVLSLRDLLTAPSDASSTRIMPTPGLTVEEPVGLLKFERAFIQANLIVRQREIVVGQPLSLEIQLANLGKTAAFLIRVEEILPEGFDLLEKPEKYMLNDGFISFKGRKLAPLETEEMELVLKPKRKGKFVFTPKIKFMNETGEQQSCQVEQLTVSVKELGIRGWLRGPS